MSNVDTRYSLEGRRAIVCGAACGLGRAITHEFLCAGAEVLAVDIDADGLATTVSQAGSDATLDSRVADVRDNDDVAAFTVEFAAGAQPIDCLVYGAALRYTVSTIVELAPDAWRDQIDVNLTGAFVTARNVIPFMPRGGSIILIASQLGSVGSAGAPAYCASKGGLIQLARSIAIDHACDGIRANTLSPGAIGTERLEARFGDLDKANAALGPRHVMGRIGTADEIVGAARFLASDASQFMTGADLVVDGGYTSH